jgi:hypothetical protein
MISRRTLVLLAGDLVALALFAILGGNAHNEAVGFEAVRAVAGTAAPFLIGWFVTSLPLGVLRPTATSTPAQMIRDTLATWVVAFPLAMLLRGLALSRTSPLSFYIVACSFPLLLLLAWRLAVTFIDTRRGFRGPASS